MTATATRTAATPSARRAPDNRWLVLAIIGTAQLMVVLDVTIVNIALPSAQRDLGFSDDNRQWVVTAYALAFGSLLLLGGRLSDLLGRRVTLLAGLLGFAGASAVGGAAPTFGTLIAARVVQGLCAAVLAPAALSTLNVTFTDAKERARAFGIYSAIAAGGSMVGLIVGGALTEWLSWRWCLYVNLAFALPAAFGVARKVEGRADRSRLRIDLPGVLTVSGGLFCLVYGLSRTKQDGWGSAGPISLFVASAVLLASFVLVERSVANPLLPLRVLADRNRAGAYISIGLAFSGMFGGFLFLTYFLQQNLGYSPIQTGLAFLPMTAGIMLSAGLANTRLFPRFGPRPLVPVGFVIGAVAMVWFGQLSTSSSYAGGVLAPMIICGVGVGLAFAPAIATGTLGVDPADAGVGSAMVNTSQQVGGAVGTAVLSTVFSSALSDYLMSHGPTAQAAAAVHGYSAAFLVGAAVFVGGAVLAALLFRSGRVDSDDPVAGAGS